MPPDLQSRVAELEAAVSTLHAKHSGHESLCTERWTESRAALTRMTQSVDKFMDEQRANHVANIARFQSIERLADRARGAWWAVTVLAAVIGTLATMISRTIIH